MCIIHAAGLFISSLSHRLGLSKHSPNILCYKQEKTRTGHASALLWAAVRATWEQVGVTVGKQGGDGSGQRTAYARTW